MSAHDQQGGGAAERLTAYLDRRAEQPNAAETDAITRLSRGVALRYADLRAVLAELSRLREENGRLQHFIMTCARCYHSAYQHSQPSEWEPDVCTLAGCGCPDRLSRAHLLHIADEDGECVPGCPTCAGKQWRAGQPERDARLDAVLRMCDEADEQVQVDDGDGLSKIATAAVRAVLSGSGEPARDIHKLIERSSLGEPDAVAARATVDPETAAEVARRSKLPPRLAVDADGFVWRVWDDMWSMAPSNPDNSPIPEPVTYYEPTQTEGTS